MLRLIRRICVVILAGAILTLWLVVAVLWVRSYFRGDVIVVRSIVRDEPGLPLPPRVRGDTFVMLSGHGGIALATRRLRHDPATIPFTPIDERSWTVYSDPAYPQPNSPIAVTGTMMFWTRVGPPTTTPGGRSFGPGSATFTVTSRPGQTVWVTSAGPGPQTITVGQANQGAPRRQLTVNASGLAVAGPPGPTTMGNALANNAIAAPPAPLPGLRQFFVYSAGQPIDPVTDLGDISRVVIFPWWAAQALMSVPMLWVVILIRNALRRRFRAKTGCCVRCGYDLRATPDRCPECGMEAAVKANIATT